jgi:aconitase B
MKCPAAACAWATRPRCGRRHRGLHQHPQLPQPLGKNTNVYLGSAELAAIASKLGRIPTVAEYQADMGVVNKDGSKIYKYMNFDQIEEYA